MSEGVERKMKINTEVRESVHELLKMTAAANKRTAYEQAAIYVEEGIRNDPTAQRLAAAIATEPPAQQ